MCIPAPELHVEPSTSATDSGKLQGRRYESARFDDDQNTCLIKAGTGVNARAEWRLTPALNAYLAADNLMNANIETGRSAVGVVTLDSPRMVRVGLTLARWIPPIMRTRR